MLMATTTIHHAVPIIQLVNKRLDEVLISHVCFSFRFEKVTHVLDASLPVSSASAISIVVSCSTAGLRGGPRRVGDGDALPKQHPLALGGGELFDRGEFFGGGIDWLSHCVAHDVGQVFAQRRSSAAWSVGLVIASGPVTVPVTKAVTEAVTVTGCSCHGP
jgi:hypothetical protein